MAKKIGKDRWDQMGLGEYSEEAIVEEFLCPTSLEDESAKENHVITHTTAKARSVRAIAEQASAFVMAKWTGILPSWVRPASQQTWRPVNAIIDGIAIEFATDADKFNALADAWQREQAGLSVVPMRSDHYLQIIGMGEAAIPFLLLGVFEESGHWFTALRQITGEQVVVPEIRGNYEKMKEAWLNWGKKYGYWNSAWTVASRQLEEFVRERLRLEKPRK